MEFCVLGPVTVVDGGVEHVLGSTREGALLADLLVHAGEVVSAGRLIEDLWRGEPSPGAIATLQTYVRNLRRLIEPGRARGSVGEVLSTARPGYVLHAHTDGVDAWRAERLVEQGRAALAAGDAERASRLLREAVALWRGPAFGDLGCEMYLQAEASRLDELLVAATEDRVEADLAVGRHGAVCGELEGLVAVHPYRERLWGQWMLALYRSGRQVDALRVYRRLRRLFADELGIEPGARLRELEAAILRHSPDLECPALPSLSASRTNLPSELSTFVGRAEEMVAVAEALSNRRLVTVTGVGGVGKTRLALRIAAQRLPEFRDGVWLCELAAVSRPDDIVEAVLAALGMPVRSDAGTVEPLVESLTTRKVLLVLDNCEHLLDGVGRVVEAVMRACPGVRILATSREGLAVEGEQIWPLRPLPLPEPTAELAAVAASDAVELFIDRAAAVRPDFALDASNAPAVARICRRLDGMPLAMELAAARVGAFAPEHIAGLLDDRFRLLTGGRRTAVERHQTLRATVDWSYALLSARERAVFGRLGVFVGGFDAEAAVAVAAADGLEKWDVLDALSHLVAKSMVVADDRPPATARYRMLETLRQYALERLAEQEPVDRWRLRHARHFAEFAKLAGPALRGPDELVWRTRLREELDNLRAAVTWSLETDDDQLGVTIIAWLVRAAGQEAATGLAAWAEAAIDRARCSPPGIRMAVLSAAALSVFLKTTDQVRANALALEAFETGDPADCPMVEGCYLIRALTHIVLGQLDQALEVLTQGQRTLDATGAPVAAHATLHDGLAFVHEKLGHTELAQREAYECVRLARAAANPSLLAKALCILGRRVWTDEPDAALAMLDESIQWTEAGASGVSYGYALSLRARLRAHAGLPRAALVDLGHAIAYSRDKGDWYMVATAVERGVIILTELGHLEAAAVASVLVTVGALTDLSIMLGRERPDLDRSQERLRADVGDERYTALLASTSKLSRHDATEHLLNRLDQIISGLDPDDQPTQHVEAAAANEAPTIARAPATPTRRIQPFRRSTPDNRKPRPERDS
jgi:predicted ATPase/DNA-binding SARP family transcriptional activator